MRYLSSVAGAMLLASCVVSPDPAPLPNQLVFEPNGYSGSMTFAPMPNSLPLICRTFADDEKQDGVLPACDGNVVVPLEFLPLSAINSEAGATFNFGYGPDANHGWLIRARCEQACPEDSDLRNLKFAPCLRENNGCGPEPYDVNRSPVQVKDGKVSFRTATFTFAPTRQSGMPRVRTLQPPPAGQPVSYPIMGETTLIYPGVYQLNENPILRGTSRPDPEQEAIPYYMAIDPAKRLSFVTRYQRTGLICPPDQPQLCCNADRFQYCEPGEPQAFFVAAQ